MLFEVSFFCEWVSAYVACVRPDLLVDVLDVFVEHALLGILPLAVRASKRFGTFVNVPVKNTVAHLSRHEVSNQHLCDKSEYFFWLPFVKKNITDLPEGQINNSSLGMMCYCGNSHVFVLNP